MSGTLPIKTGDAQQYDAEPHANYTGPDRGVMPSVKLLSMNEDPLGNLAACALMYEGKVVRSLEDVTDEQRRKAWDDVLKTHLTMPLESIKMHFMEEGVDRAFTHQLVRQRTAAYAQESLRFAVPGKLKEATSVPPSMFPLAYTEDDEPIYSDEQKSNREIWNNALDVIDAAYHYLVSNGMPAEEARGLLPHATATRVNYITDLRALADHAGNRLCTQAQFHWRLVFAEIVREIRDYGKGKPNAWQFELISESKLFRPVCYQLGRCPFKASFDRACTIRSRVDAFSSMGINSDKWGDQDYLDNCGELAIRTEEWLMDPAAARVS